MEMRPLGNTQINVSKICLGTMTWGEQNTEQQAHEQLDYAVSGGINFIDAAELYPVPPLAETAGRTESYIGTWLRKRNDRDRIILATKVAGRADWISHIRGGRQVLDRKNIEQALNDSLQRLQTDYIDLYQVHWPDRHTNFFGQLGYQHHEASPGAAIEETLAALAALVASGKVRHIGLSNETPWGVMRYLQLAQEHSYPGIVSVQNPYNLLNRTYEIGLAEISHREHVGLLAYSPLGFGVLSGKYLGGARPAGARISLWQRFDRYTNRQAELATAEYVQLARKHGLDPAQMALSYVNSRSFLTSTIIGATNMEQLRMNIDSAGVHLPEDVIMGIEDIHRRYPNPSP